MIIAIDGTSASGKGTLAVQIANQMNYFYLNTGMLYRSVAARMLSNNSDLSDNDIAIKTAINLNLDCLDSEGIYTEEVGEAASKIAAVPGVRKALISFQRKTATNPPHNKKGAIIEGRDIGTVVCPDAKIKFYLTANIRIRARRRFEQLRSKKIATTYSSIIKQIEKLLQILHIIKKEL